MSKPYDEGLEHSFCYIRPDTLAAASTASFKVHHFEETTIFLNLLWHLRQCQHNHFSLHHPCRPCVATGLHCRLRELHLLLLHPPPTRPSLLFRAPLRPPRPRQLGFLSRPIERGFMSGPLDHHAPSGRLPLRRSYGLALCRRLRHTAASLLRSLTKGITRTMPLPPPRNVLRRPFPWSLSPYPTLRATSFLCLPPSPLHPPPRDLPLVAAPPPCNLPLVTTPLPTTSSIAPSPARDLPLVDTPPSFPPRDMG